MKYCKHLSLLRFWVHACCSFFFYLIKTETDESSFISSAAQISLSAVSHQYTTFPHFRLVHNADLSAVFPKCLVCVCISAT